MEDYWWAFNGETTLEAYDSPYKIQENMSFTIFKLFHIAKASVTSKSANEKNLSTMTN